MNTKKLITEMERIETFLDDNIDATGSNFRDKILTSTKGLPKGVVEKLNYLAGLLERAQEGENLSAAELKQAGFYVNAVYPYVSNGVQYKQNKSRWASRLIWLVLAAAAIYVAYKFLS